MPRIDPVDRAQATGRARELLDDFANAAVSGLGFAFAMIWSGVSVGSLTGSPEAV